MAPSEARLATSRSCDVALARESKPRHNTLGLASPAASIHSNIVCIDLDRRSTPLVYSWPRLSSYVLPAVAAQARSLLHPQNSSMIATKDGGGWCR